jgi:hypothetical protein
VALAIAVLVGHADDVPSTAAALALAALAAGTAIGLDDPAHALLEALPTSPGRRIARRLVVLLPFAVGGYAIARVASRGATTGTWSAAGPAQLAALTAVAVALTCAWQRRRPELAAAVGAVVPIGWTLLSDAAASPDSVAGRLVGLWIDRPWLVAVAAAAWATAMVRRR